MKKVFGFVITLFTMATLIGQERVLFDASKLSEATYSSENVQTDNDADKWYLDFEGKGAGGSSKKSLIKGAGDKGVGVLVVVDSAYFNGKSISTVLRPNILPQLTENESGNGKITNVADIKSITIEGWSLGYEADITLDLQRSDGSIIGMSPQKTQQLGSSAFTVTWDNPTYISDVSKRDIKAKPVYPNTSSELILNGIKVRGKPYYNVGDKSKGYLIVYINKITVVADKAYEEEDTSNEELWGIEASNNETYGKRQEKQLEEREILRAKEQSLMASEEDKETPNSTTSEDAK